MLAVSPAPELVGQDCATCSGRRFFSAILFDVYVSWPGPNFHYLGFSLRKDGYPALFLSLPLISKTVKP
jgi:hypothetical protein